MRAELGHAEDAPLPILDVFLDESIVYQDGVEASIDTMKRLWCGAVVTPHGENLCTSVQQVASMIWAKDSYWDHRLSGKDQNTKKTPSWRRRHFRKVGLHFTDDDLTIQKDGLNEMLKHDFRAFVIYSDFGILGRDREKDLQLLLYYTLSRNVLARYSGHHLNFMFEVETSLDKFFGRVLEESRLSLQHNMPRIPSASASVTIITKPDGGLSTVDYILGLSELITDPPGGMIGPLQALTDSARARISHCHSYDNSLHLDRYGMLVEPHWASDIPDRKAGPVGSSTNTSCIPSSPVGPPVFAASRRELAAALNVEPERLDSAIEKSSDRGSYRFFDIRRRGKTRSLIVPRDATLSDVIDRLYMYMRPLDRVMHPSCIGYRPRKSAVRAARPHAGKAWIQVLDVEEFFPSISRRMLLEMFNGLGASDDVSEAVSNLITFDDRLTLGSRIAPLISNLVLREADDMIGGLADERNLIYTRYADDMYFSGDYKFDVSQDVSEILGPRGFTLNVSKSTLRPHGQGMRLAGFAVQDPAGPRVPRYLKERFRREIFALERYIVGISDNGIPFGNPLPRDSRGESRRVCSGLHRDPDRFIISPADLESLRGLYRYISGCERAIRDEKGMSWVDRQCKKYPRAAHLLTGKSSAQLRLEDAESVLWRIKDSRESACYPVCPASITPPRSSLTPARRS